MANRAILLVDVSPSTQEAFELRARRFGVPVIETQGEIVCSENLANVVLCVIEVCGPNENILDRVRSVLKTVRPSPVVVIGRDLRASMGAKLAHLGIACVIDLPRSSEDMLAEAFQHIGDPSEALGGNLIIGEGEAMRAVRREVTAVAKTRSTVLIIGETGTGKGLVARAIHDLSRSRQEPFIHVDCAALSPTVIESELFGHERGAFTGASDLRRGRFELAGDGTVFLDEIGDLDTTLQAKLLRVLQDRTFERVGGARTLALKARVVAATNRDLSQDTKEGRFRADLFYRLNVFRIRVPPLREHRTDIPALVRAGLDRLSGVLAVPTPQVSDAFYEQLLSHSWPGNVRELFNVLERCLIQRRVDTLRPEDLDGIIEVSSVGKPEIPVNLPEPGPNEERLIRRVLRDVGGNVTRASRRLGMPRGTLRYKIRRYRLESLIPRD
jgi:two-component system NtrC family response regulator